MRKYFSVACRIFYFCLVWWIKFQSGAKICSSLRESFQCSGVLVIQFSPYAKLSLEMILTSVLDFEQTGSCEWRWRSRGIAEPHWNGSNNLETIMAAGSNFRSIFFQYWFNLYVGYGLVRWCQCCCVIRMIRKPIVVFICSGRTPRLRTFALWNGYGGVIKSWI